MVYTPAGKLPTIGSSANTIPRLPRLPKRTIPKGTRPRPPGNMGGKRLKPITVKPIVTKPITPPPAPLKPDFSSWYKTDPRYLLQNPQFQAARSQTYAQYGWHPVLDAAGRPVLDATGKPQYRQASGVEDPGSVVNQLARSLAGQSQQIQDTANSRGLLFSGAQAQGQQNALSENDQRLSEAQLAFQRALSGINTDESNLVSELYPDYLAQAPPAGPKPPAAAKPGAKPTITAAAAAEADRQRRIKKAQDHLRQDKINAAKRKKLKRRPRPTTTGKKPTIGSSANSLRGM